MIEGIGSISIDRFQSIVLKLSNQTFVRHWLWINHPNLPQLMGIAFDGNHSVVRPTAKRERSCECGACRTCKHREYMSARRPKSDKWSLAVELKILGFVWHEESQMWRVYRQESVDLEADAGTKGNGNA